MPEAPGSKKQDRFFRLLIPADLSELSKARRLMEEVGRAAGLPDERIFDLQVATSEAAANAIEHAASEVEIAAWLLPDRVMVEVTNDGAFQPGLYKDDEHRRRGLGLPLMVSLADQVHVSRMSESQTRVSLTFFLGPRSQRDREGLSASPDAAVHQLEAETMKLELMTTRAQALDDERVLTHEKMRQRVEELEKVMDIVPVAIWVAHDPECLDITGNQTANEFYEALPDENVSAGPAPGVQDTTRRFFQGGRELRPEELPMQEAAARGTDVRDSELQVLRPSGALMTILGNASPLGDAQGRVRGCVGAFVDITERKHAEEALRASEQAARDAEGRYRNLFDTLIEGFCTIEVIFDEENNPIDYRFLEINKAFEELTGLHDAQGRLMRELAPDHEEHWFQIYGKVALTGESARFQAPATALGRFYDVSAYRVGGAESRQVAILFNDMTDMKLAEEALRSSEERFRLMFERHNAVMLLIDPNTGAIVDGNTAAMQFYGYSTDELRALSIHDLNRLPAEQVAAEYQKAAAEEQSHFVFPHVAAGGETRWVDVHSAPLEVQGRQLLFSIIQDITERKQAEEALRESEEYFRLLHDTMLQAVVYQNADGTIASVNPAAERILGRSREEVVGLTSEGVQPDTFREDGSPFPAEEHPAMVALASGQEVRDVLMQIYNPREDRYHLVNIQAVPLFREGEDKPFRAYTIFEDLTERKRAEDERERLLAQERELAHELGVTNEELQSQNEEIAAQAEELEAQTEELAAQNEELRVAHEELGVLYDRELKDARLKDALRQVDQSLISSLEHTEILNRALKDGAHVLGAEGAVLEVREGDGWVVRSVFDLPPDLVGLRLSREEASVATAMEEIGEVLAIEDARLDRRMSASTLSRYGTTAALALPISYKDRILGSLQFLFVSGPHRFSAAEIDFAVKLAVSIALALENARLFETQKNIASQLQQTILEMPAGIPHLRFSHLYRAATEEAIVGGDFYDAFELEDGSIALLVGDVSGHGINAARVATMVKAGLVAFTHSNTDPDEVLALVNRLLLRKSIPGFTSLLFAVFHPDTGMLTYCSAGHPNLLLGRATGVGFFQGANHTPLGIFPDWSCSSESVRLEPGDTLLFYTDGLTEARRDGELFGEDRLLEAFRGKLDLPLGQLPQALLGEVLVFTGGKLQDDVAILAVQPLFERFGEDG